MEALESILGSQVQSKKTQRQDWKSSDGKQRREKTHTEERAKNKKTLAKQAIMGSNPVKCHDRIGTYLI